MASVQKWRLKVVKNYWPEEGQEEENHLLFLYKIMKSKILALSKNEEFKNLLKQKKITNKYVSIFFGKLLNKDKKRLNISFVTKKKNW